MGDFPCDLCSKTYSHTKELIAHRKHSHSTAPNYNCTLCYEKFVMKRDLMTHRKTFHGLESMKCNICGKDYFSKASLRYHLKTHTRPYHCELCQRSYDNQNRFANHMRKSHNIEKAVSTNAATQSQFNHVSTETATTRNDNASTTSQEDTNANQSNLTTSFSLNMTPLEENYEYCILVHDDDSESDTSESNGSYSSFQPTPNNCNLSVDKGQISDNGSTHSVDQLNPNCQQTNFRPSPNSHPPSPEIICIEDTQDMTLDSIGNGHKIDNDSTSDASQYYAASPEYTKVGECGFKESPGQNFESSCSCSDTEQENENNIEITPSDANLLKVQRETCIDTLDHKTVPSIHLDNFSPSADDRQMHLGSDQQKSDHEIPASDKKWEEQCKNCHVTFKDMQLFNNHEASCSVALVEQQSYYLKLAKSIESKDSHLEHTATTDLIDLTKESYDKEMLTEQLFFKENAIENCDLDAFNSTSQEENGIQCKFCDNVFKDMSILQAHREKCFLALTTQSLSKNCEITYTCKMCKIVFKSLTSYEVHEMKCSTSLGALDAYSSESENSCTMEQDLNETKEMLFSTSQTDVLKNSEESSLSENPFSVLSIDEIESEYRVPSDHHEKPTENSGEEHLNEHKNTVLQGDEVDEMQYIPTLVEFQCMHCRMKFQTHEEHHKHELTHELMENIPTGITYICIVCGDSFDMTEKIIQHVSTHKPQDFATMEKCSF